VRARGEDTPSEPESSREDDKEEDEDKEIGEVTPPPHSSPHEALPLLGDIFSRQAKIVVGVCRMKRPRTEDEPSSGSLSQPRLTLVSPDSQGMSVVLVLTKTTHLFEVLQAPPSSPATGVATAMMAGSSSSGSGGAEPPPRIPSLGPSCRHPLDMRMVLFVGLYHSRFSRSCPEFKR
jgi:hypothetical protein